MKIYCIMILLISISMCCNSKPIKTNDLEKNNNIISNDEQCKSEHALVDTIRLYKDEFILRALETDLTLPQIIFKYNNVIPQNQYIPNAHQSSLTDTLIKIISNEDTIVFHQGGGNTILEKMDIKSQIVTIDNNIHVGVTKEFLEQKFNVTQLTNVFIVQDTEGGNIFTFYISNNILVKISFEVVYF